MEDVKEFLKEKRIEYEKRAERLDERIEMFQRAYETNEKARGSVNGHPRAIIPDTNGRNQYNNAVSKQNELYALVNFIEELEGKFFNEQIK